MSANKDNDENVSFTESNIEGQINSDLSETESMIMSGVNAKLTPTVSKVSLDDLFNFMKAQDVKNESRLNEINSNLNAKLDEVNTKMNNKLNEQHNEIKLIRNEIKHQNFSMNQHYETNTRCNNMKEQIIESISNNCKKINEMNKRLDRKLNQIMNKKVSDSVRNMTNNNNDKIVEVVELEDKRYWIKY